MKNYVWTLALWIAVLGMAFPAAPATALSEASPEPPAGAGQAANEAGRATTREGTVTLTVKASPGSTFPSVMTLRTPKLYRTIDHAKTRSAAGESESAAILSDTELLLQPDQGRVVRYGVFADGNLLSPNGGQVLELPDPSRRLLRDAVQTVRAEHYGEPLTWADASKLFPRKSVFTIIDLETGLRFRGQRRAGSSHADVQPLTKQDTAIMKQIYAGAWSWDRRAVLVEANGRRVAASMHGMPHGGDGIPGNGFKGHFCVHFLGSVTHGSGSLDLAHQAMASKASGKLDDFLRSLPPEQVVLLSLIALNQKDPYLLERLVLPTLASKPTWFDTAAKDIRLVRPLQAPKQKQEPSPAPGSESAEHRELPLTAVIYRSDNSQRRVSLMFTLQKRPSDGAWQIAAIQGDSQK